MPQHACSAGDLSLHLGNVRTSGIQVTLDVTITNGGPQPCSIPQWPTVQLLNDSPTVGRPSASLRLAGVDEETSDSILATTLDVPSHGTATAQLTYLPSNKLSDGSLWVPTSIAVEVRPDLVLTAPWTGASVDPMDGATHPGTYAGPFAIDE